MVLYILRALFVLLMAAVGFSYKSEDSTTWLVMVLTLSIGVLVVLVDILSPRRKLAVLSGTFLGLIVGIFIAYALSFVVQLIINQYIPSISPAAARFLTIPVMPEGQNGFVPVWATTRPSGEPLAVLPPGITTYGDLIARFVNLLVGIISCYFAISFILQTKDDFRFIIPYVEFSKETKGARPILLDTSVLIDGRINDVAATGILESKLVIPRFVINELQMVADSSDKLKRNRGRRGLDILAKLQANNRVEVILYEPTREEPAVNDVDQQLVTLAHDLKARIVTNDFNLNKVAQLRGVDVINLNDLANALKPAVLPGEKMTVRIVKPGEEIGQGIGYLEDGTMVVVEQGRAHLNEEVELIVTSALQTSAGRMIFGRVGDAPAVPPRRLRPRPDSRPPGN